MLKSKLTIDRIANQLKNKNILIRVDFNCPIKEGKVKDDTRVRESIKTIKFAIENGANCISLMSHLGRPNGEKNLQFSLKPIVPVVSKYLNKEVEFLPDCVGAETIQVRSKF